MYTNKREREKNTHSGKVSSTSRTFGAPFFRRRKERSNKKENNAKRTTATVSPSFSFLLSLSLRFSDASPRFWDLYASARHFQNLRRRPFETALMMMRDKNARSRSTKGRKKGREWKREKKKTRLLKVVHVVVVLLDDLLFRNNRRSRRRRPPRIAHLLF